MDLVIANQIRECFLGDHQTLLVILYGSFAKGKENRNSDIDLAILRNNKISFEERLDLASQLNLKFSREVDLVDLRVTNGTLLQEIMTTGKVLIKRNSEDYADLIRRMVYEEADFMPIYRRILKGRRDRFLVGERFLGEKE